MAKNPKMSNAAANLAADAVVDELDNGYIRVYDGTQPTDADTAIGSQVLLSELRWANPAFGSAVAGIATANAITSDPSAAATGTATWFRALKADGSTVVFDGSVGVGVYNLDLDDNNIVAGGTVTVNSFTYKQSKG
jgi:hypothetical protein